CARIARPAFEFSVRLTHWAWARMLEAPPSAAGGGAAPALALSDAECALLCAEVRAAFARLVEEAYVAPGKRFRGATPDGEDDASARLREMRALEVSVVGGHSLMYVTRRDEPFLRVRYF